MSQKNTVKNVLIAGMQAGVEIIDEYRDARTLRRRGKIGRMILSLGLGEMNSADNRYTTREGAVRVYNDRETGRRVMELIQEPFHTTVSVNPDNPQDIHAVQVLDGRKFEYPPVNPNQYLVLATVRDSVKTVANIQRVPDFSYVE